ncbi:MAG TPA: amidohydrolase family protein [Longimicrobium sp.]|nr:amidohydrolase family protein [Longimicrobium sp.]
MIVDCHTHLNRYTPDLPTALEDRHRLLQSVMDANGIAYALVISSYDVTPDRPPTEEVMACVADDPRIGVVAAATARMLETGDFSELRRVLATGTIKALKLYPGYVPIALNDRRTRPVYELAAEFGVPVMIHTGDTYERRAKVRFAHPLEVDDVAVDHREVTFLMAHVGNPWFLDAAEVIYKNENVVGDICGLTVGEFQPRYAALARAKLNECIAFINDPTKLLFGTDWPISDVASYLEFVRTLDATEEELEGMLWRNAVRVYGLELGEGRADGGRA